jgi:hypothetical protein
MNKNERVIRYSGVGKIQPRVDGVLGGIINAGGITEVAITPQFEKTPVPCYQPGREGTNIKVLNPKIPAKITIKFNTSGEAIHQAALAANIIENVTVTGTTVTAEDHLAYNNKQIKLDNRNITTLTSITTNVKGSGTNYESDTAGYAIGETVINLITGTGTILEGNICTFAGDDNEYAVKSFADGVLTLFSGLKQAIPAAETAFTLSNQRTLTVTTDYDQDTFEGDFIEVRNIPDGAILLANYTYGDSFSTQYTSSNNVLGCYFTLLTQDIESGRKGRLHIEYANFVPTSAFNFITVKDVLMPEFDIDATTEGGNAEWWFEEFE